MKIAMIGAGYVGLVSGVCFADFGHDVICVEKAPDKLKRLLSGEVPIYEPGLDTLLHQNVEAGRLSFTDNLKEAMEGASAIFIAVDSVAPIATGLRMCMNAGTWCAEWPSAGGLKRTDARALTADTL